MKHYGDITKIHGNEVPIVDIITGGSPCQDLSVAGKRAGLAGERSGLFMDQIRIIKEMRDETKRNNGATAPRPDNDIRPRYMVWENVAGAFSSGTPRGADFKAVLEEIIKVVCKDIPDIPIPKEGWHYAGCIEGMGDDGCPWSVAWRLHDAQYWGVPQRRKRISLIADFGGNSASKILFEPESVSGDPNKSSQKGKTAPGDFGKGSEKAVKCLNGWDVQLVARGPGAVFENHSQDTRYRPLGETCQTVTAGWGMGGNNQPLVVEIPIIRRLTPTECERLQGYPDGWTDIGEWIDSKGKKHKEADSHRYKALGNSIALPFWEWMAERMIKQLKDDGVEEPTMASLFDGIGGFPLVYQRHGCQPVWASEIEEFPIAVTKYHFGEE